MKTEVKLKTKFQGEPVDIDIKVDMTTKEMLFYVKNIMPKLIKLIK